MSAFHSLWYNSFIGLLVLLLALIASLRHRQPDRRAKRPTAPKVKTKRHIHESIYTIVVHKVGIIEYCACGYQCKNIFNNWYIPFMPDRFLPEEIRKVLLDNREHKPALQPTSSSERLALTKSPL